MIKIILQQKRYYAAFLAAMFVIFVSGVSLADEVRQTLFRDLDSKFRKAESLNAKVLSPKYYETAKNYYQKAIGKFDSGQGIKKIRKDTFKAEENFELAIAASKKAKVSLKSLIEARNDALEAGVKNHSQARWIVADKEFTAATRKLEAGNEKKALVVGKKAQNLFREAELDAIKLNYLSETSRLIEGLQNDKVERYAPKTMVLAQALLAKAEKKFEENRYDTDEPRALAKEAKYQADHARYIATLAKSVKENALTVEDVVLSNEVPVKSIADSLDLVSNFDKGLGDVSEEIKRQIELLKKDAVELVDRRNELTALEDEIIDLQKKVGVQSQHLAEQEKKRLKFDRLEKLLRQKNVAVLKKNNNIIVRSDNLNFESNATDIQSKHFGILKTIQDGLRLYPGYRVMVEGHTDSFGSNEQNLTLSVERARSVREFFIANMPERNASSITSVGYGESRPIANNERPEGREKNRRIDFVLMP